MYVVPDDNLVAGTLQCISPAANPCYQKFNSLMSNYIFQCKALHRVFPKDIALYISHINDPRNHIHTFSKPPGIITVNRKPVRFKFCMRCFQKIMI